MRLNEVIYTDARPVEGYAPEGFRVGGEVIRGDLLCAPDGVRTWGGFDDLEALAPFVGQVDVLFVGTGAEMAHLPDALEAWCEAKGLAVEAMATPAACRTYNVLLSEGRRIALAAVRVAA